MNHVNRVSIALLLTLAIGLGACGKKPPVAAPPPPPPPPATTPAPPPPPPPPAPAPISEDEIFARKSLDQLNAERPLGDAYFDYDKSDVRDDARGPLQNNADWLRRWASTKITVEGHCDERGSSEYNIALGDRRAKAVQAYLVSLGIAADRIVTVSKGKEQPVCSDHAESCWQQNRRGHFIVSAK